MHDKKDFDNGALFDDGVKLVENDIASILLDAGISGDVVAVDYEQLPRWLRRQNKYRGMNRSLCRPFTRHKSRGASIIY